MPIVTEDSQPKRPRAPWWVLWLALLALLPVGLIAWSIFHPVDISWGSRRLRLGMVPVYLVYDGPSPPKRWTSAVSLPLELGTYYIVWETHAD